MTAADRYIRGNVGRVAHVRTRLYVEDSSSRTNTWRRFIDMSVSDMLCFHYMFAITRSACTAAARLGLKTDTDAFVKHR